MPTMYCLRLIFIWSLLQFDHSYCEEEWKARMTALERTVEELQREAMTRNEFIRLLSRGVTCEGADNSNTGDSSTFQGKEVAEVKEATEDQGISPVTIVEARREMMGDKTKFTVKYKQEVGDLNIKWYDQTSLTFVDDHTDTSLGDGNRETSVLVSSKAYNVEDMDNNHPATDFENTIGVTFVASNGYEVLVIMRKKEGDVVETDLTLPVLKVEPAGDFVYEEGHDILFKATTPPDDLPGMIFQARFLVLNLETGKSEMVYGDSEFIELMSNESYPEYHEWDIKLKSSEEKASGIITVLAMKESQTETSLVGFLRITKNTIFRPSTQDGPFPTGYISLVREPREYQEDLVLDDGTSAQRVVCNRDERGQCTFSCLAIGDDIADVEVYKVESDGTETPVSEISRFALLQIPEVNIYVRRAYVKFSMDNTADLDSERFRCIATNALGKTTTSYIVTEYFTELRLLPEESGVQILNPNEASALLDIKVVCKVQGKPEPNVTFTLDTLKSFEFGLAPDEVIDEGNDVYSAAMYLTYDPSDPYGYNSEHSGRLQSASCNAQLGAPYYGYDYYDIPVPPEIRES